MLAFPRASRSILRAGNFYPQRLLYRAFFSWRYSGLLPDKWAIILASPAAFAFLHIIFRYWMAVAGAVMRRGGELRQPSRRPGPAHARMSIAADICA
jgi:hypothetical protein